MNRQQLVQFAQLLGLKKIDATTRAGWVQARCPFAHWRHEKGTDTSPSFAMQVGKQFCHCFSCDWSSDLGTMLYRLAVFAKGNKPAGERIRAATTYLDTEGKTVLRIGKQDEDEEDEKDIITEWEEWRISSYLPAYSHPYLAGRAGGPVPEAVGALMDFRYDAVRKRLGVPVRNFDGALMGFHGRDVTGANKIPYLAYTLGKDPETKKSFGYNRPVWLGEHWIDFSKPVLVVESVFDLARALQIYRNSMCPLMASLNKQKATRISEAMWIAEMFDPDKAGQKAVQKLKQYLPDTQFVSPGLPDGYKDPGDMEAEVLAARLAPYLTLDELLT